jgi:hypothetical protein
MIKLKALILLGVVESIIIVNVSEAIDGNEPNGLTTLLEQSKQIRSRVLQTHLAALPDTADSAEKIALGKTILQISNIKIPSARNLQKGAATLEAAPPEPNVIGATKLPSTQTQIRGQIDARTLEEIIVAARDPNTIVEPLALAQMLYNTGHSKEAAVFYEIALGRKTVVGHILTNDDKAWILLQLAACRRDNPEAALAALDKLLADYSQSAWASIAVTKRDILLWYQKDKPQSLLETGHD